MKINNRFTSIITNVFYAFTAQSISLILSVLLSLIVPKILGVEEFSYWQLSVFYTSYLGFFHFGLNDGIYLRIGGKKYEDLDFKSLGSQFWIVFILHCMLGCLLILYSISFVDDWNRRFIFITTAIYLPLINAIGFIGYVFQAVNRTRLFSLSVIIDKVWFIIVVIVLLILRCDNFIWFIIFDLFGKIFSLIFCSIRGKEIIITSIPKLKKKIVKEIFQNISIGAILMISNVSSLLILGMGRFVVDKNWGIQVFGIFSLALTLATFLLSFIAQVSMVLFPALRQTDEVQQRKIFWISRDILGVFLPGILLLYMPLYFILDSWLPQYKQSLVYLIILLPLCVYEGKMNLLCTTYFKVLRLERKLLKFNLMSLVLSVFLALLGGYIFDNIYIVVISSVTSIAFRSIVSEFHLSKLMGKKTFSGAIEETLLVIVFVSATWSMGSLKGFFIYLFFYAVYLYLSKDRVKNVILFFRN